MNWNYDMASMPVGVRCALSVEMDDGGICFYDHGELESSGEIIVRIGSWGMPATLAPHRAYAWWPTPYEAAPLPEDVAPAE